MHLTGNAVPNRQLPEAAERLGEISDFVLYFQFIPLARYSARAMAYVYVTSRSGGLVFTQVAAMHRRVAPEMTDDELEKRLVIDAVSRAKIRITDGSFEEGEAYTIELDARSVQGRE